MKIKLLLLLLVLAFGVWGCTHKKEAPAGAQTKKIILKVTGMTCGACEYVVKKSALKVAGVVEASADHRKEQAVVTVIEGQVSLSDLIEAINKTG